MNIFELKSYTKVMNLSHFYSLYIDISLKDSRIDKNLGFFEISMLRIFTSATI